MVCLSVCLIARNEERNPPRALESIGGIADEAIVTDTGSADATADIAAQFGAHVRRFAWCDDFSAPRNFTLGQARADGPSGSMQTGNCFPCRTRNSVGS